MRHVVLATGSQIFNSFLAMVAGIIVARWLGAAARGTVSVLTALGSMAVLLGSFGVHFSVVYFQGQLPERRGEVVSTTATFACLGAVATTLSLGGIGLVFRHDLLSHIAIVLFFVYLAGVPFLYLNQFGRAILFGAGYIRAAYIPNFLEGSGLVVGTIASVVTFGHDLVPLVLLRGAVEVAICIYLAAAITRRMAVGARLNGSMFRRQLSFGLRNYASALLWVVLLQSDVVLCNSFLGSAATGVYSVAVSLGLPMTVFAGAVGQLVFQRVSAGTDRAERIATFNGALRTLVPMLAVEVIAGAVLAIWIVPTIYGAEFQGAVQALFLLAPGLFAYSIVFVVMNYLSGEGSPRVIVWAPLAGVVVNLAANIFVIPRFGINGASVTSSAGYTLVLLVVLRYYRGSTRSSLRDMFVIRTADIRKLLRAEPVASAGRV